MDDRIKQLLLLGREHYAKGELEKAEHALRLVLDEEDRFADVHDMLGVIAHQRGNFVQAERHFQRALEINPGYTEAALNLAVTYNDRGKYAAARELHEQIQARRDASPHDRLDPFARGKIANMHADLSQAYSDCGLIDDAVAELTKAVMLCPQFADLRTRLGNLLREQGDVDGARREHQAAVEARPTYVPARIQLGVTMLALGEPEAAAAEWQVALDHEPDNARAKMYLRALARERAKSSAPPASK